MIESLTSSDSPVRLAMVGLGPQGHEHLHAARLSKQVTFVAAVDPNPQARAAAIHRFPQLTSGTFDCLQPLREMELDGLVLALPHHAYQHMWSDLLAFKLPMLKEKPLARTLEEAMKFLNAAQLAQCPLQTAIQRRHHPSYVHCRQAIRERGERILEIHAAPVLREVRAERSGMLVKMDADSIGRACIALGGGRTKATDTIDYAVGVSGVAKVGTSVSVGDPLLTIHARDSQTLTGALGYLEGATAID